MSGCGIFIKKSGMSSKRDRDIESFKKIFDAYYENIRRFIYFKSGDTALADDLVQEVFLKIWGMRRILRNETIRPLLYTIAGNLLKNHYNRRKIEFNFARKPASAGSSEPASFEMETREFEKILFETLASIPEKSRVVFLMNRIEKLTYNEIAESLGLSVKAVEKRMKAALEHIRNRIAYKV
jgi:RNA polymerase sigma-70 factor (family 1)